ncbi:MAG: KH domain-containing protein [Candidatus Babeliaceae bacterium]
MAMKELIEFMVKKLVENPDKVIISEITSDEKTIIQVHVAAQDIGRVIGSDGRTFRALRAVLHLLGQDKKYDLVVDIAA